MAQAITALYDQRNPAQQQEANTWLTSFSATDGAWEAGVNLLGAGATEASAWVTSCPEERSDHNILV